LVSINEQALLKCFYASNKACRIGQKKKNNHEKDIPVLPSLISMLYGAKPVGAKSGAPSNQNIKGKNKISISCLKRYRFFI